MQALSFGSLILLQLFHPDGVHASPYHEFRPLPLSDTPGSSWIPLLLFFSFTLLVIVRVFDGKRLSQLVSGFFRASSVSLLYREEYALTSRVSILALLNFLVVTPLFLWQTLHRQAILTGGLAEYGILVALLAILYMVKISTTRFIGYVVDKQELAIEYNYNVLLFNKTLGLLLFPITTLLAFTHAIPSSWLIFAGFGFWGIILVYRIIRGIIIGVLEPGVSVYYLFVYLCTLEILPFVVLLKVFVGTPK